MFDKYWLCLAVKDTENSGYCDLSGKMLDVYSILEQVPFQVFSAS